MSVLDAICDLVRACGQVVKQANRDELNVDEKSGRANFVTAYDKKVQEILRAGLLEIVPDAGFVGEEDEQQAFSDQGKFFIVDPIDGTTNFIKDYHLSCISVGLIVDGKAQIGVVFNPYLDELFYAERGKGAYCNGKPIHVSDEPLEHGVVLFGTSPYHEDLSEASFKMAFEYFKKALDIRRSGSAAWDLCCIAAGRAELYFELILCPWDYAAGGLIVEEAGGIVTDVNGQPIRYDQSCSLIAKNM